MTSGRLKGALQARDSGDHLGLGIAEALNDPAQD